jgi:hypothetical protein
MNRVLCLIMLTTACFGDVPPPPPRGAPITLVIHSEEASAFSLRIPLDLLQKSGAAGPTDGAGDGRMRSAVGGAFFSLAFVLAGMLLVRSKRRAVLAVGVLALAGTGAVIAQLTHPANLDPGSLTELRRVMDTSKNLSGKVAVQIVPSGEPLTLVVPGPRQPRFRPH